MHGGPNPERPMEDVYPNWTWRYVNDHHELQQLLQQQHRWNGHCKRKKSFYIPNLARTIKNAKQSISLSCGMHS